MASGAYRVCYQQNANNGNMAENNMANRIASEYRSWRKYETNKKE